MAEFAGSRAYETLLKRQYFPTVIREKSIDVTTTPTVIAENNPRRLFLLIANHGTENVRVAFSTDKLEASGVVIAPYGGTLSLLLDEDYESVTYTVYAQSTTSTVRIYVFEVIAQ